MKINIDAIKKRLFEISRNQIVTHYSIEAKLATPDDLANAVLNKIDQAPSKFPLSEHFDNRTVFRAATFTLGSNSRNWTTFLNREQSLRVLLQQYDPISTIQCNISCNELKAYFPGVTSSSDACALLSWARLLSEVPNYYELIVNLGKAFRELSRVPGNIEQVEISDAELVLCIVAYVASPPSNWRGQMLLGEASGFKMWKAPGMGYILASEFFRNLHWNAFKPDRHVKRLFENWGLVAHYQPKIQETLNRLIDLIGPTGNQKMLKDYLSFSLIGHAASPSGIDLSHVDNLVWLLGAYAEKKGKESATDYLIH